MVISNPLMVHAISYVFWIALGLATGEATAQALAAGGPGKSPASAKVRTSLIGVTVSIALVASVPLRAAREVAATDLSGVTYGLSGWRVSSDGIPSRLSGAQATLFVSADARWVDLPIRGTLPTGGSQIVEVLVDGRLANELAVGRDWQHLTLRLSTDQTTRSRRIDLRVAPTWTPSDREASPNGPRTLGIEMGKLDVVRGANPGR
jgi:hypothetical protein